MFIATLYVYRQTFFEDIHVGKRLINYRILGTESNYLGCSSMCHQSTRCLSFNWCHKRVCQLNSGHRNTEEGQVNFISDDGCVYCGWATDDGPVCEDGLEWGIFCRYPWRQNPEWSGWEPRYVFKDNANQYIERQDQFCGKLKNESDCTDGESYRFPVSFRFYHHYRTWEAARKIYYIFIYSVN